MIIEPEARMGFWSLVMLIRLHQDPNMRAAVDVADEALIEFDAKAREINTSQKEQPS